MMVHGQHGTATCGAYSARCTCCTLGVKRVHGAAHWPTASSAPPTVSVACVEEDEELKIRVDGGKAKSYAYRFCSLVGCYAQIGLTQADVDAFKRGAGATLTIVPAQAPDQKVDIKASLSGFTAAFENTSVLRN